MASATFDLAEARQFQLRKFEKRRTELDARFDKAWREFEAIVKMIIDKYDPEAVWQWGSLLKREHFSEISDIDIALAGHIPAERFFKLYGDAMALTFFPLDIVELDRIDPLHAESIRQKGKLVYARA